jgi:hypothetical protein
VVQAAGAGTVTVAVSADRLDVLAATPAPGWRAEIEVASGREVEVDFRQGGDRVQVNLELEDGTVRERIRIRDDAGTDVRIEDGAIVRADEPGDDRGDDNKADDDQADDNAGQGSVNSGPGSVNSGPGDDDAVDKSGHNADDPAGDDDGVDDGADDHGGHGADDGTVDDHGGHGADDPAGDDHGGDD